MQAGSGGGFLHSLNVEQGRYAMHTSEKPAMEFGVRGVACSVCRWQVVPSVKLNRRLRGFLSCFDGSSL